MNKKKYIKSLIFVLLTLSMSQLIYSDNICGEDNNNCIYFNPEPATKVYIDNEYIGETPMPPINLNQYSSGFHFVKLESLNPEITTENSIFTTSFSVDSNPNEDIMITVDTYENKLIADALPYSTDFDKSQYFIDNAQQLSQEDLTNPGTYTINDKEIFVDNNGNIYTDEDEDGTFETQDGLNQAEKDEEGNFVVTQSLADFQYNIFAAGMGYLQLGSRLADWTGVDSWAIGENILHSWVTTQEGWESTWCGRWTDGTNWPANYMMGENGFPAVHIEGEKINYTWINDSWSYQGGSQGPEQNVYAYKITFEVNPRDELTDDDYIQFQLKIDGEVYDLNGNETGGETVKLKTGSAPYSKKGQEMIIEVYGPIANATGTEDPEYKTICLVFNNEFNYPYSKTIKNNKLCNSFIEKSGGQLGYGNIFGIGHYSSGGSSSSGEEGEERP